MTVDLDFLCIVLGMIGEHAGHKHPLECVCVLFDVFEREGRVRVSS